MKLPDIIHNHNYLNSIKKSAPFYPPLGLGVITAHLRRRGFFVKQDDLNIKTYDYINNFDLKLILDQKLLRKYIVGKISHPLLETNILNIIKQTDIKGYDVILISKGDVYLSIAICKKLKELVGIPIIMGNWDTEELGFPDILKIALEKEYIDYVIDGAGAESLFLLLNSIKEKAKQNGIPGLIYFNNKKLIKNRQGKTAPPIKSDFRGLPLEKYKWDSKNFRIKGLKREDRILILPFKFIEGCSNSCIFCRSSTSKPFYMDPKTTVKCLKELREEHNTKYFYFLNDAVNTSKSYINDLCNEIINENLDILWMDCANFKNLDRDIIFKMRKAGCISLVLGLETGSQRLLDYIEKGFTIKHASNVLRWLNKAGIWTRIEIISGLPTETRFDIKKTISFLNKNRALIDKIDIYRFCLIKKSRLFIFSKKYCLSNIRYVPNINKKNINSFDPYIFEYDVNNTKWETVVKKIEHSYDVTKRNSPYSISALEFEQTPFLFLLYSNLKDKIKIRKVYHRTIIFLAIKHCIINVMKNPKKILQIYKDLEINKLKSKFKILKFYFLTRKKL